MTKSVVRTGVDSLVRNDGTRAKKNFHKTPRLRIAQSGPAQRSFVRFKSPAPKNATILEAKLVYVQANNPPGSPSITLTAQRVAQDWNQSRITWNNQPGVVGAPTSVTKSGGGDDGVLWEFDVTSQIQAITNGAANNGFRIVSNSTNQVVFYSQNAAHHRPYLMVRWSTAPRKPTKLVPSSGTIAASHPVLKCDYTDRSGSTDLNAIHVQIDDSPGMGSPIFDSGGLLAEEPQLELADTAFGGWGEGQTLYWRIRVQDGDNLWSEWSDAAAVTRIAKGVVTITNPPNVTTPYVSEFTPPIGWSFSVAQSHYQVFLTPANNPKRILWDSEKVQSSENDVTIPKNVLVDGRSYRVYVRCWDTYADRQRTVGDPVYAQASRDFIVAYDPSINPPSTIAATVTENLPFVSLLWTRPTSPDSWTILRDGVAIDTDVDPSDIVDLDGFTYRYRDETARPEVPHQYRVRAEVNGALSDGGPSVTVTPICVGTWLYDPATNTAVVLGGKGIDAGSSDLAETFDKVGSTGVVRSVMGIGGLSGQVTDMMLRSREGRPWQEAEQRLWGFKGRPSDEFRLIWGDTNIPVVIGDLSIVPHAETISGDVRKSVSFKFWQTDEYMFDGDL